MTGVELEIILKAGKILLSSGAEISRTEDTMNYIARAMNFKYLEAYVSNRGIFATAKKADETEITRIYNVPEVDINLSKIESVNALSRRITQKNITIEEIESELNQIDTMSDYSFFWRLVAYTLGASGFSYAIGSSITDSIIAGIIGLILGVYMCTIKRILSSDVLITILGSILIALLGNLFIHFELGSNLSVILLGAMIDIVPGVPFVNAIREYSQNNYNTGITLMMGALLTCISMAVGVAVVQSLLFNTQMIPLYTSNLDTNSLTSMFMRSIMAGIGTTAFAILFRVAKQHFIDCTILGFISWFLFLTLSSLQSNVMLSIFISGFIIAIASRILAVKRKCPAIVFLMTSLFPLLPGLSFYRSIYYMLMGQETIAISFAKESFLIAFTIAISIVIVKHIKPPRIKKHTYK
ncbi:threonine/serine exporter family protein [uncultured Veillonella sp.]|uniref:threonine/serine ThrE exporter family protein n=1 Tax=uncultured Veillonella sp. TaxID=159268 RepID=UPI0028065733|nr:threonine/serine exporter family protein [uncultured Veillonella sp.]